MPTNIETKPCPQCGKKMIKRYNRILPSYPPLYPWEWWCGCGHVEEGGCERGSTLEEQSMSLWKAANQKEVTNYV
jgi:hypothetical protein